MLKIDLQACGNDIVVFYPQKILLYNTVVT